MRRLRVDRVAWAELDGDVVALDLETSAYFTLNASGSLLLRRLELGATLEDLAGELVAHFAVDMATARRDAAAFLAALDARQLLQAT